MNSRIIPSKLLGLSLVGLSLVSVVLFSGCGDSFQLPSSGDEIRYQHAVATLNQKAQEYMNSGKILDAVSRLEAALDLMPGEYQTMNNLAVAYYNAERYEQAIQTYDKITQLQAAADKLGSYYKSEAVAYEALADRQLRSIAEANLPPTGKAAKDVQKKALESLDKAIELYKKALENGQGLVAADTDTQSPRALSTQIKAVEDQKKRIESGEG